MKTLLEKTRRINRLLQKSAGTQVNFNELASVLADLIGADVYVASRKGKILGLGLTAGDATPTRTSPSPRSTTAL